MKLAIMQPYFFPYLGYFQLMNSVDQMVIYDNVQFSKGGWIQRNRILVEGREKMISLPLKSASDFLDIRERLLAESYPAERSRVLRQIEAAYRKAPFFQPVMHLVEHCMYCHQRNLFGFLFHALLHVQQYLQIDTELIVASSVPLEPSLRGRARVMALCAALGADRYINAIGGQALYRKDEFAAQGILLSFIRSNPLAYAQSANWPFVPNLSIIDVMMFNSVERICEMLGNYELF